MRILAKVPQPESLFSQSCLTRAKTPLLKTLLCGVGRADGGCQGDISEKRNDKSMGHHLFISEKEGSKEINFK